MVRSLIASLAAGFMLIAGAGVVEAAPIQIKVSTQSPLGNPPADILVEWGKALEEATGGRYVVDVMVAGKLGSAQTELQAVQQGTIQFCMTSTGNISAFMPILSIFDLPYFVERLDSNTEKIMASPAIMKILDQASTKRMKNLSVWGCTPRVFTLRKPVQKLEDFKGLKFRTTPSKMHIAIMDALGAAPVPMAWTECYTSCQQGVIEGLDPELPTAVVQHWEEVAPHWSMFDVMTNSMLMCVNVRWWNKLPDADRAIFEKTIKEYSAKCIRTQRETNERYVKELAEQGRPIFIPSQEELGRWKDATKDVYKQFPDLPSDLIEGVRKTFDEFYAE